jgi:hypothetical protein
MTDLVAVLEEVGCGEVRTATGDWTAVSEAAALEGETTETVHVLVWSSDPVAVLQDPETGEQIGEARQSCPVLPESPAP